MVIGEGQPGRYLSDDAMRRVVSAALDTLPLDGRRLLVIIPDGTRTMPMPVMFDLIAGAAGARVSALDYLVALGTHRPMTDDQLARLVGHPVRRGRVGRSAIFNHRWDDPATFVTLGTIPGAELAALTGGVLARDVPVSLNRLVLEYDHLLVCGPVFPHEVAGFSGGNKYFFPGIAGREIIDFTHWLGALLTSSRVIGTRDTPVRAVIDRAASFIDRPASCLALVTTHDGTAGLFFGSPVEAWQAAADLSARIHVVHLDRPVERVLSIMPGMYDDLWTAAKGMYKVEPVVADGGEVIIYAPHVAEVSFTHGALLDEIGYHCRDYFVAQWAKFCRHQGGVLAHSTHVKGLGWYDVSRGVETSRIRVTLATEIPRERCARVNLGYLDWRTIDVRRLQEEGVFVVPRAGEILYRLPN